MRYELDSRTGEKILKMNNNKKNSKINFKEEINQVELHKYFHSKVYSNFLNQS